VYCPQCKKALEPGNVFCGACGARNEPITQVEPPASAPVWTSPPPSPPPPPLSYAEKSSGSSSGKGLFIGLAALLGVFAIVLGVFLFIKIGELNDARLTISDLEHNVTVLEANAYSLEGRLAAEQANVTNLNTQLVAEKARADTLQADLSSAQGDITALEAELSISRTRVSELEAEIAAAEARIAALQADLAKANADLVSAQSANTTLQNSLNTIRSPRHFNNLTELTQWLAADDTNTNPAYATLNNLEKAFVLQVKALRDGYIISTIADWDNQYIYYGNSAIAGGTLYSIDLDTDTTIMGPYVSVALRPLS